MTLNRTLFNVINIMRNQFLLHAQVWISKFFSVKLYLFSYPSVLAYVLGAQKNSLIETVLLITHNICLGQRIRILFLGMHLITKDLYMQTKKEHISLHICAGWSAPLLFHVKIVSVARNRFSYNAAYITVSKK